jgi:hypothetical protein
MAYSVVASNSDNIFVVGGGHLKERVYAVPPSTIADLAAELQAVMTTVDVKELWRVQEDSLRRTAFCTETGEENL